MNKLLEWDVSVWLLLSDRGLLPGRCKMFLASDRYAALATMTDNEDDKILAPDHRPARQRPCSWSSICNRRLTSTSDNPTQDLKYLMSDLLHTARRRLQWLVCQEERNSLQPWEYHCCVQVLCPLTRRVVPLFQRRQRSDSCWDAWLSPDEPSRDPGNLWCFQVYQMKACQCWRRFAWINW